MQPPLLKGMEGVFIPIKDPQMSAKWYEENLGFTLLYLEEDLYSIPIFMDSIRTLVTSVVRDSKCR